MCLRFSFQTTDKLYLVTDYYSGGNLFAHLKSSKYFDENRAKFYAAELLLALDHLHKMDIIYRDLKLENIMITPPSDDNERLRVHLIDYGFVDKFIKNGTNDHIEEGETVDNFRGNLLFSSVH